MTTTEADTGASAMGLPSFAYIPLRRRNGEPAGVAVVDRADADALRKHRWYLKEGYAARQEPHEGKQRTVLMHRVILGLVPGDGLEADHISRDRLDNRRVNLRVTTHAQNMQNKKPWGKSAHRGVTFVKSARSKPWRARARVDGKDVLIGDFATEDEAGKAAADFRREHMPFSID